MKGFIRIPCCVRSLEVATTTATTASIGCPYCGYEPETIAVFASSIEKPEPKPKPVKLKVLPQILIGNHFKPKLPTGFQPKFFKEGRI